jgi:hypothetical protein
MDTKANYKKEALKRLGNSKPLLNAMLGEWIGCGISREVFECPYDERLVIKVAIDTPNANVLEWEMWDIVQYSDQSKWFAPCEFISDDGLILVQKRTTPLEDTKGLRIPTYFTDVKDSNFGTIDGEVVCHDYASSLVRFMLFGMPNRLVDYNRAYKRCDGVRES